MNLGRSFWVKKSFNGIPDQLESTASIHNTRTIRRAMRAISQCNNKMNVHGVEISLHTSIKMMEFVLNFSSIKLQLHEQLI
jgi:hypothetical protein